MRGFTELSTPQKADFSPSFCGGAPHPPATFVPHAAGLLPGQGERPHAFDFDTPRRARSRLDFDSGSKRPPSGEKRTIVRGPTRLGVIMYGAAAGTIDLGDDPPLVIGQQGRQARRPPIQRAISWRWLTGTVLTGVTSVALMGAALMAALNNPNQFASLPDAFAQLRRRFVRHRLRPEGRPHPPPS